ncbi:hypothetical protein X566_11920 [Afipia sp. P52-10]|uniref:IclR family transcriptional regulator n=1 Tax=Afipia sp. P52-10 TaxID=1429916 RepID=UPI0003DF2375|nr:IclR family transcriptional regulator [Afipia sp. P52-10]ETR79084.1 hypothetical protein X566_11920 [Afipia sp. P52-10]
MKTAVPDQEDEQLGAGGPADYLGPRSPVRVMQIVELLAESPQGLTLTQLSERLGIPKTSLFSHLRVMTASGHVALQDGTKYGLGPASIRLGAVIAATSSVLAAARPLLDELVRQTGETALLAMLDAEHHQAVYIDRAEGTRPVRYTPTIGARRPLYCTAFGRALLAFQNNDGYIAPYLASDSIVEITANTITAPDALMTALADVRNSRVAATQEEHTLDAGAIGAPVFDRQGNVQYAIGIALPASRLGGEQRSRLTELVLDAARRLSWTLGAP